MALGRRDSLFLKSRRATSDPTHRSNKSIYSHIIQQWVEWASVTAFPRLVLNALKEKLMNGGSNHDHWRLRVAMAAAPAESYKWRDREIYQASHAGTLAAVDRWPKHRAW